MFRDISLNNSGSNFFLIYKIGKILSHMDNIVWKRSCGRKMKSENENEERE